MKTQTIHFTQFTTCERDFGRGFQPHTLAPTTYEVSNLVIVNDIISFDLYDDQGWIGMYIVRNVNLTPQVDGSMMCTPRTVFDMISDKYTDLKIKLSTPLVNPDFLRIFTL